MRVGGGLVVFTTTYALRSLRVYVPKHMNSFRWWHFDSLAATGRATHPVAALCEHKWQYELLYERSFIESCILVFTRKLSIYIYIYIHIHNVESYNVFVRLRYIYIYIYIHIHILIYIYMYSLSLSLFLSTWVYIYIYIFISQGGH